MKRMTVLALLIAAAAGPAPAQTPPPPTAKPAAIAGRVTASDSGRPIRGAAVVALSWEVMRVPKTVATDAQGRFEFTGLVPGRYELSVSVTGYLPYGLHSSREGDAPPPIDLRAGERFDNAEIRLRRPGAIEGRLLDEFGDPAPNVQVQVTRFEYAAGRRRLLPVAGRTATRATDDRGRFRVFGLSPGWYYVTALGGAFVEEGGPSGYAPTYYPGTADITAAKPVEVPAGRATPEVSFAMSAVPTVRVAGTLTGGDGQLTTGSLILTVRDSLRSAAFMMARVIASKDGRFEFRNVPPGTYTIQAWGRPVAQGGNLNAAEFGWLPVSVGGTDLANVAVKVAPGVSARGRIVFEDSQVPLPAPRQVRVAGRPVEFDSAPMIGGPVPTATKADWSFEVQNLAGPQVVRADVQSPDWALKRITLDGKDVTDTPIDFKDKDVDGLEVLLTTRNASISGSVADEAGRAAGRYTVIAFALDPSRWTFPSRFIAVGRPNQDGRFRVANLPPEDYLVVAVPTLQGTEWQDPDYLASLRSIARHVTLTEGEARTIDLTLRR